MESTRRDEIVELAYDFVCEHGLANVSLRPVAEAAGSSTGVLRFLFGSKDGLLTALLDRARRDELELLAGLPAGDLADTAAAAWKWISAPRHERLLAVWAECYTASLQDPDGAAAGFAAATVRDWLGAFAEAQPRTERRSAAGVARRSAVLALLRGATLDLLATGERTRINRAVTSGIAAITTS